MKYRSISNPSVEMLSVDIPPGVLTSVDVSDADDYYVTFDVLSDSDLPPSQAKIARPIALQQLARTQQEAFDISLVVASERLDNGKLITRTMGAMLRGAGKNIDFQHGKSRASDFVKHCLTKKWKTVYKAQDGNQYTAVVDFEKLSFETEMFTGRFTDLAFFEERDGCCVRATWDVQGTTGEVQFKIARANPDYLDGQYVFAGKQGLFFWHSGN